MKNKRFASTMIAAASAFCIAMTGMLPVQAAEATPQPVQLVDADSTEKLSYFFGRSNDIAVAIYGDSSVSVAQDNGKTVMSIRAADTTAAKESNSDVTGNTSGTTSGNTNADTLPPGTTMTQPAEVSAVEIASGDQNGTSTGNTSGTASGAGLSDAASGNTNVDTSDVKNIEAIGTASGNQYATGASNMYGAGSGIYNDTNYFGTEMGVASGDQNIAVSVFGTTYHGNTDIVISENQTVNIAVQDGKGFSLTTEGNKLDKKEVSGLLKQSDNDSKAKHLSASRLVAIITLSQEDVGKLCDQLFIVQDKNIIINLTWYEANKDKPEMAGNIANLKNYFVAGDYTFYGVQLPVNSITTTSEAFELFQERLAEIEKAASEAAQRGSGGPAASTTTDSETHTDNNNTQTDGPKKDG